MLHSLSCFLNMYISVEKLFTSMEIVKVHSIEMIPSLKLTSHLKMDGWKMKIPFGFRPNFQV